MVEDVYNFEVSHNSPVYPLDLKLGWTVITLSQGKGCPYHNSTTVSIMTYSSDNCRTLNMKYTLGKCREQDPFLLVLYLRGNGNNGPVPTDVLRRSWYKNNGRYYSSYSRVLRSRWWNDFSSRLGSEWCVLYKEQDQGRGVTRRTLPPSLLINLFLFMK